METVNLFWDNQPLKNINHLCILSLAEYNNRINIFTYKPDLFENYSNTVSVYNANEIVEEKDKFYYTGNGDCYNRSVVGFSDLFRYKLLRKVGGWYFDFDTIALKPFSAELIERETVIRPHFTYKAVCNICKFNKDNPVLDELYYETKKQVTERNNKWSLPIEIFYQIIEKNHLNSQIVDKSYFGDDNYNFIRNILFQKNVKI